MTKTLGTTILERIGQTPWARLENITAEKCLRERFWDEE
jgi:hypothetical protein